MSTHDHAVYSHHDGQFLCSCGAVRIAVGIWASAEETRKLRAAAKRETRKLVAKYGTSVDAYGQRKA